MYESNPDPACSHLSDASRRRARTRRYRARIHHGEARRRVLEETSRRESARRSDDKKAAKAEKKAQKKEKQKADLADSAQFKGFDKVVVAELHFDDDDVKKSGFDLPFDADKTALTREEWDGALAEINGVFNHTGIMAVLCCLCGDPEVPTRRGNSEFKFTRSPRRHPRRTTSATSRRSANRSRRSTRRGA